MLFNLSQILNTVFLNDYYTKLGAKLVPFAGYSMPINFSSGIIKEHQHTRLKCGLFDISHMGQMLIPNYKDNFNKLETIIPQSLIQLPTSQAVYSFILNEDGGIVDDCIISKLIIDSIEYLFVVYNASRKKIDEKIISNLVSNQIVIKNNSFIALQGPSSSKVISVVFPLACELKFMQIESFIFNKENILISRSGYTGEDGFELSVPNTQIQNIVEKFSNHNDTLLCGLGSRDSLRLEAGLCLYGNELNETISPIEANLKWAISKNRLKQGGFAGYDRIIDALRSGTSKTRIGIKSINKSILRSQMSLHNNTGIKVGEITSGGFSPSLNLSIAMAYINKNYLKSSNEIYCSVRGNMDLINISKLPFIKLNYHRSK